MARSYYNKKDRKLITGKYLNSANNYALVELDLSKFVIPIVIENNSKGSNI